MINDILTGPITAGDYVLRKGETAPQPNPVAQQLNQAKLALRKRLTALDASFTGAVIALAFVEFPWLASFTFELEASAEYNDEGGSYRSISASVSSVELVASEEVPDELKVSGEPDECRLQDEVVSFFQGGDEADIYGTFTHDDEYTTLEFTFRRDSIADLLAADELSGHEAFLKLFPNDHHLVTETTEETALIG